MLRRPELLFACSAMIIIVFALLAEIFPLSLGAAIIVGGRSFAFRLQTPLFVFAGLFCLFSAIYDFGYLPFNQTLALLHPWLTIAGFLLICAGHLGLGYSDKFSAHPGLTAFLPYGIASSWAAGAVVFTVAQVWFAIGLLQAVVAMRRS